MVWRNLAGAVCPCSVWNTWDSNLSLSISPYCAVMPRSCFPRYI